MITKGFFTELGEVIDRHRKLWRERRSLTAATSFHQPPTRFRWLLPTPGNLLFTVLVIGSLLWAQNAGALSLNMPTAAITSTSGLPYQGRLADKSGAPLTQTVNMIFRLYAAASGGSPLWEEQWTGANSVQVSDGLFNVMLGSLTPILPAVITANNNLFLGITVGTDSEMSPRVQLGSVPFATQALTVPDGSITTAKIANGSITSEKLAQRVGQETNQTLTLANGLLTTSKVTANFGTINLATKSDLHVTGMWVLQNNSAAIGMRAALVIDGAKQSIYGDVVPIPQSGIGYTIPFNYYVPAVAAGTHTLSVEIDQHPGRTNDTLWLGSNSVMWIRAVPAE